MAEPRRIGPYTIVSELGRGAMGVVHLATDPSGRAIALKSLTVPDDSLSARLLREASVRIDHPNVVRVLAAGLDAEGMPYLAMERLEGQPLSTVLAAGVTTERALEIVADAARGLAAVHARRLVHRDVKPANLFVTHDGTLKVLDFGMAAHLENVSLLTATGAVVGTPAYLSPEQAAGKREIDARSDVFSLGAVLYEALTGRRPFERVGMLATLLAVLTEAPPPLGFAGAHPELEALVLACLEKDPAERPQTMDALLSRIEQLPRVRYTSRPAPLPLASEGTWRSIAFALFDEVEARVELEARAAAEGAAVVPLLSRALVVVFGGEVASKDELPRALTFSLENARGRAVVGLGRLRDESLIATSLPAQAASDRGGLESGPLERALATLAHLSHGVAMDRSLSALLGGDLDVEPLSDGTSVRVRSFRAADAPPELVGRDRELELLDEALERIEREKRPGLLVVGGAPGIGKTALARAFAERARGFVVHAPAVRGKSPFASLAAALGLDLRDREGGLDGTRVRLLDRLAELLEREGTVMLVLDPIEQLDAQSRALLLDLGELFEDRALALLVAARSTPEIAASFAGRLAVDAALALDPLPGPAIARLAERMLHRPLAHEEAALLRDRSGGNPFFVEQLVRLGRAGPLRESAVPATVESAVQALIDGLVPPTREALMRLALLGPDAPIEHARAVLGPDADAHLSGLVDVGILRGRDTPTVLFRSRLVPEIAESLFDGDHRARLHHELATRLSTLVPLDAEAVAHHATLGGDRGLASQYAGAALRTAAHSGDGEAVLRYLDAALFGAPKSERFALYSLAAGAAAFTEEPARQRALLEAALDAATSPRERATIDVELAERDRRDGALDAADARLVRALASSSDPELTVRATARRALVLVSRGEPHQAAELLRALDVATSPASRALLWDTRGYVEGALDQLGPRRQAYANAADDYGAAGDLRRRAGALGNLGDSMLRMGDLSAAERMLREAASGARRVGNHLTDAYVRTNLASCLAMLGRKREALATLDAAVGKAERVGDARLLRIQAAYRARLESGPAPPELSTWAHDASDPTLAALASTALLARGEASDDDVRAAVALVTTEPAEEGVEEGLLDLLHALSARGARPELAEVARRACARTLASLHEAAWRDTYRAFVRTRYDRPEWLAP